MNDKKYILLVITNHKPDDMGDKIIEICDISIISAVMKNLGCNFEIESVDVGTVMRQNIENADILIMGRSKVDNRSDLNIGSDEIYIMAKEYGKPIVHFPDEQLSALFSNMVFEKFLGDKESGGRKKIGIFITHANGFAENGVDFPENKLSELWMSLAGVLGEKGYDYEFLTNGHFEDEAFLDELINKYKMNSEKCIFNMDTPEKLIHKISHYDGVISCVLFPCVTAYSLQIPSVGVISEDDITEFYGSVGFGNYAIDTEGITAERILEMLEDAMHRGEKSDRKWIMMEYESLFATISCTLQVKRTTVRSYDYNDLLNSIVSYKGTTETERKNIFESKLHDIYLNYNIITAETTQE